MHLTLMHQIKEIAKLHFFMEVNSSISFVFVSVSVLTELVFFSAFFLVCRFSTMGIDLDTHDVSVRQRNVDNRSSQSPSLDLVNNNNSEKCSDRNEQSAYGFESDFDAHATTLDPVLTDQFKHTTERLSHDEALHKLQEFGAKTPILPSQIGTDFSFKREVVWKNAIGFLLLHICAVIGVVIGILGHAKGYTLLYCEYDNGLICKVCQRTVLTWLDSNDLIFLRSFLHISIWIVVRLWIGRYGGCASSLVPSRV